MCFRSLVNNLHLLLLTNDQIFTRFLNVSLFNLYSTKIHTLTDLAHIGLLLIWNLYLICDTFCHFINCHLWHFRNLFIIIVSSIGRSHNFLVLNIFKFILKQLILYLFVSGYYLRCLEWYAFNTLVAEFATFVGWWRKFSLFFSKRLLFCIIYITINWIIATHFVTFTFFIDFLLKLT